MYACCVPARVCDWKRLELRFIPSNYCYHLHLAVPSMPPSLLSSGVHRKNNIRLSHVFHRATDDDSLSFSFLFSKTFDVQVVQIIPNQQTILFALRTTLCVFDEYSRRRERIHSFSFFNLLASSIVVRCLGSLPMPSVVNRTDWIVINIYCYGGEGRYWIFYFYTKHCLVWFCISTKLSHDGSGDGVVTATATYYRSHNCTIRHTYTQVIHSTNSSVDFRSFSRCCCCCLLFHFIVWWLRDLLLFLSFVYLYTPASHSLVY